jgi:F-type H+-transporting ATPase subunit delta
VRETQESGWGPAPLNMTSRTIAARYAKALLDVNLKEGDPRAAEQDLAAFVELMRSHLDLQQALTNPAVPLQKKEAIVKALLDRSRPDPVVRRTILMLASRDRLGILPELLANYRDRLLDREGIVRAEIATATPVGVDRLQRIERGLAAASGKRVTMTTRVDPSIIGGVVARVGGTVYDGSISTQLRKMKETMKGSGL